MENKKPLIEFNAFKDRLMAMGIKINNSANTSGYTLIDSQDVTINDLLDGTLGITDEGIFNVDNNTGEARRVFLYKSEYKLRQYGPPKYHICKCRTIIDFMNFDGSIPKYRQSNSMHVKVINLDDNRKEVELDNLPLCKNCARILGDADLNMTSYEFAELLRRTWQTSQVSNRQVEVDVNGYTRDWQAISQQFRKRHNYTCERCGVKVMGFMESEFIQTHHRNGDKTNNDESNLECLCIKCHSEIDTTHHNNFSTPAQQYLIREFMQKYGDKRFK